MQFDVDAERVTAEAEVIGAHDGTIRDLVFTHDDTLVSGGAGDFALCVSDCASARPVGRLVGHADAILGLYEWRAGGGVVSCSVDRSTRFWDLRCATAIRVLGGRASPVTSVCLDPSGRLLVSGHEDATVTLFDVVGGRVVQTYRPHGDEVRTVRFSQAGFYLLSGSYDRRVTISDMRGDLASPLSYVPVAEHRDKVIICRWHPHDFSFCSTSADRSATIWRLP